MKFIRRNNTAAIFAVLFSVFHYGQTFSQSGSVLATGTWYKLAVTQKGIYQITGTDLQQQGIDLSSLNPEEIQVYGHGGGMLPQELDQPRRNDIPENAIYVSGGEDGKLDEQDYILFYGESPDRIGYQFQNDTWEFAYQKNLYSDTTFYFLTFGQQTGKRVSTAENIKTVLATLATFDDYAVHEQDLTNILAGTMSGSGREWYGELFESGESLSLNFNFPGLLGNSEIRVAVDVLGKAKSNAGFDVFLNNQELGKITLDPLLEGTYNEKGKPGSGLFVSNSSQIHASEGKLTVKLNYQSGEARGSAHLNRVLLGGSRQLQLYDQQTFFRNIRSLEYPAVAYQIQTSADQVKVWDITDPQSPREQTYEIQNGQVTFGAYTNGQLKEYVIFTTREWLKPEWQGTIPNQNLKDKPVPGMVIVSHPSFLPEAHRLAQLREQQEGITVKVVTPQQIYNEFSSGAQDISAIRNYLKYWYDQEAGQLKYLLLFGKCSYDYKDRVDRNTNLVPTYESRNSIHPIYSYSSDDYFGFLDDDEGYWNESFAGDHTLDIGVGRFPVKRPEEAKALVDKLIHYSTSTQTLGDWKNQVVFVADDGDGDKHQRDADRLAAQIDTGYFNFNVRKIYTDAYPQESLPGGERAPEVNDAIGDVIKKGALLVNYTGHGNERQWANEKILDAEMINQWKNLDKLPFFVTATCEFGRYDDPITVSGAERLILNPKGGAIGMVTTSRPVFANSNFLLNQAFYQQIFQQVDGQYQTLGQVFRNTKNAGLNGRVNRNFSLLGDPSMSLAYPKDKVVIDSVLAMTPEGGFISTDVLKALSHIKVKGRVVRWNETSTHQNFNGILHLSVFDKPVQTRTKGNEGTVMQFEERKSVIHRGKASINNGFFELEFVVPKNIAYKDGQGKISFYAEGQDLADAHGAGIDLQVGGSSEVMGDDQQAPEIALYMDDTTFVTGGVTADNTTLLALLQDENGINISNNGLGQDITAILRKRGQDQVQTFVLNEFFTTAVDNYQQGVLTYPLENLEEGTYFLTLQVWDNSNNKSEETITFVVPSQEQLAISSFYNVPNPFGQRTVFTIDHNRPGDYLKVEIRILNLQGQLVHTFEKFYQEASTRINDMAWEGMDAHGMRLRPGVYLASVILQSQTDGAQKEKVQKIIIIN